MSDANTIREEQNTEINFRPSLQTLTLLQEKGIGVQDALKIEGSIGTSFHMQPKEKATSAVKDLSRRAGVPMSKFNPEMKTSIETIKMTLSELVATVSNIVPRFPEFTREMCKDLLLLRGLAENLKTKDNEPVLRTDMLTLIKNTVKDTSLQKLLTVLLTNSDAKVNLNHLNALVAELVEGTDIPNEIKVPQGHVATGVRGLVPARRGADTHDNAVSVDEAGRVIITD